jgi:predicted flap endonuclease-1-like 5' DNA nuclease
MSRKLTAVIGLLLAGLSLCGFSGPASQSTPLRELVQGTEEPAGTPWWVWLLIIVVLLFAVLLWWLWWRGKTEDKELSAAEPKRAVPASEPERIAEAIPASEPMHAAEMVLPQPDDLEIIEGIGPKIAGLLRAAGITDFAQLADADVNRLQEILSAAKLRLADPTTWAEQAKLAAKGDWSALEAFQNELKGGRRA